MPLHSIRDGACTCGDADCGSPGKHPRTRRGLKEATTDAAVIERFRRRWPDANIGIRTGPRPAGGGCFAIDIDPRHGGDQSLATLVQEHGELPVTTEAITGGGGRHLIFDLPDGLPIGNRSNVLPGIDVRGEDGYILVAPSSHASGRIYEWRPEQGPVDKMPTPPPDWLIALVTKPARKKKASREKSDLHPSSPSGSRSPTP